MDAWRSFAWQAEALHEQPSSLPSHFAYTQTPIHTATPLSTLSRNHKRQFSLEPRSACSPWPRARVLDPTLANPTSLHDDASSSMRCQTGSPIAAHGWIAPLRLRSHSTRRLCAGDYPSALCAALPETISAPIRLRSHSTRRLCAGDSSSALCSALPKSISNKATHSALNAAVPQ